MKAAGAYLSAAGGPLDSERLRALLLVNVASAAGSMTRAEIRRELLPLTLERLSASEGRAAIETELSGLLAAGLLKGRAAMVASAAGASQAAVFLGLRGDLQTFLLNGEVTIAAQTLAKALALEREPAKRVAALATVDGLRLAIVQHAYGVKIKGLITASRLRQALAAVALERAFGNQLTAGLAGKLGLSAKAGRVLAGQLARKPRDFGTDKRLIAALAAEYVGGSCADLPALRLRVLQGYLFPSRGHCPGEQPPSGEVAARPRESEPFAERPDLHGFASEVRGHAAISAQGWAGDRKAFISHVWRLLCERRPEWGLSEIEFKCMLAEAHRRGQLVLANADLKDKSNLRDVQDSALVYKNAVFHFVRVDV